MDENIESSHDVNVTFANEENAARDIPRKINEKKLSLLHDNLIISMPSNFICASLVLFSTSIISYNTSIWGWYFINILISVLRLVLPYYYRSRVKNIHAQFLIFLFGAVLTAILWGIMDTVFLTNNEIQQMIVIVIVAGISAGGIQTLQASFLISVLSTVIMLLPLSIWIFLQNDLAHIILGISTTTYLVSMLAISYKGNKMLIKILTLNYENLALIDNLSLANRKLHDYAMISEKNEIMLRNTLENAPIGMMLISSEGTCLQSNHALNQMFGYSDAEFKKINIKDIIYAEDLDAYINQRQNLIDGKNTTTQIERRYIHKKGQLIWGLINTSLIRDAKNEILYFVEQILDITERKQNESLLIELNERNTSTLAQLRQRDIEMGYIKKMNDMLQICSDSNEAYGVIAAAAQDLFPLFSGGFIIYDNVNLNMKTVQQWGSVQTLRPRFNLEDCWALRGGKTYLVNELKKDLICKHFEASICGNTLCVPLISHLGITGMLYLNSPEDISITNNQVQLAENICEIARLFLANIQLRESLQDLSMHDSLTGLFNRRYMSETLGREIRQATRQDYPLCVAMLDIDYFKEFNDVHGHEAGDEVLILLAKLLKESFRGSDVACRFGGDEFIIILINSDLNSTMARLRVFCDKIKHSRVSFKGTTLSQITVSVGLVEVPKNASTVEEVIRMVDLALYKAKKSGRDTIEITTDALPNIQAN